jgi:potassium/chloride transporter 9
MELTIAPSVQMGARNLMMNSGLGCMKPNTVVLGFYDESVPNDMQSIVKTALRKTNPLIRHCIEKSCGKLYSISVCWPCQYQAPHCHITICCINYLTYK